MLYLNKTFVYLYTLDINECDAKPCQQNCTNTDGSFQCYCSAGYQLNEDKISCTGALFWWLLVVVFVVVNCILLYEIIIEIILWYRYFLSKRKLSKILKQCIDSQMISVLEFHSYYLNYLNVFPWVYFIFLNMLLHRMWRTKFRWKL